MTTELHYLPLGPVNCRPTVSDFTYEEVKSGLCEGQLAVEVCESLLRRSEKEGVTYIPVCMPCYNEDVEELLKTLVSLMENFEFMQKKARLHDDESGRIINDQFRNTRAVIVPIFDGTKALSPTMRAWITANFPGLLDDMPPESKSGEVDVRVYSSTWWYYCDDTITGHMEERDSAAETTQSSLALRNFSEPDLEAGSSYPIQPSSGPIGLRASEEDISESLVRAISGAHSEDETTLKQWNYDGSFRSFSVRGMSDVGANSENILYFHIVPIVKRQNHRKHNSHQWFFDSICQGLGEKATYAFLTDCGTTYKQTCLARLVYELHLKPDLIGVTARQRVETPNNFFRPCEESAYECLRGDHSLSKKPCWKCYACYFMSPAPLQGFEFEATLIMSSAMFNLVEALPVMPGPCQLLHWQKLKNFRVVNEYFNLLFKGESKKKVPKMPKNLKRMASTGSTVSKQAVELKSPRVQDEFTYTEFLRVNMRLAEDRILSFVSVFSTGYGTKWIPGSTFFYQPELHWQSLLTQRRRWLNGTFASFLFFFKSQRAQTRISGGMFDKHKAGKNIRLMNALWGLQLIQLLLVIISPAVFASSSYIGLLDCAKRWPGGFGWAKYEIYDTSIIVADVWIGVFLAIYAVWVFYSNRVPGGKVPEGLCNFIGFVGFAYVFPVYFAIWYSVVTIGIDLISGLVIATLALPVFIALAQSATSAMLYLMYLPWFMVYIVFFLVFIPSYSFARLWDTTWGNRSTGKDSAIGEAMERGMKSRNTFLNILLVALNISLVWAFVHLFRLGYVAIMTFMLIVFFPMIIQLVCSFLFLFIVVPLRSLRSRTVETPTQTVFLKSDGGNIYAQNSISPKTTESAASYEDDDSSPVYDPSNIVPNPILKSGSDTSSRSNKRVTYSDA